MNEILNAMKARRSCRAYKPDAVPKELLDQIAEAGLYAASGMNQQAARIVIVTDRALRDRLSEMNRKVGGWDAGFDPFYGAPALMIVLADKSCRTAVYDGSLVMGNLMLAAHASGLGSCWIHRAKEEFESEEGRALLAEWGIEGDWEGIGHCILGYRADELPAPPERKPGRIKEV
ncbi:MAG: nitroreductase [Oscillospiraceae bacterium]|nr:nitroreductase [Oscillospiraceae bacterium]